MLLYIMAIFLLEVGQKQGGLSILFSFFIEVESFYHIFKHLKPPLTK